MAAEGVQVAGEHPTISEMESYIPWDKRAQKAENEIPRLFVHGFIYSLIALAIYFIFIMMLFLFASIGGLLGIIIALLFLAEMIGGVNVGLADAIWQIKCRPGQRNILGHGGLLFVFLLMTGLMGLPLTIVFVTMGFALYIIGQLLYLLLFSFIDGIVCRFVALQFEIGTDEQRPLAADLVSATCPHCNARYAYSSSSMDENGTVACQNCAQRFTLPVGPELG